MNKYSVGSLKRISKAAARKLWGQGHTISLCPNNLRPDGGWRPNVDYFNEEQKTRDFDAVVNEFEYFNCTGTETGKYTAFYLRAPEVNNLAEKLDKVNIGAKI